MRKKLRIGILGGSFNPPHNGHIHISQQVLKELNLHQIWWMVSPQNPLKSTAESFDERLKLCREMVKDHPSIKVVDYEYSLQPNRKKYYTYNLLKRLKTMFRDYEFYLIIGADNLVNFHKWYKFRQIPQLAKIVVVNRPGYKTKALSSPAAKLNLHSIFLQGKMMDISSTELRKK